MFPRKTKIERILEQFPWLFCLKSEWDSDAEVRVVRIRDDQLLRQGYADPEIKWWVHAECRIADYFSTAVLPLCHQNSSLGASVVDTVHSALPKFAPTHLISHEEGPGHYPYLIYRPPLKTSLNEACQRNLWRR